MIDEHRSFSSIDERVIPKHIEFLVRDARAIKMKASTVVLIAS